MSGRQTFPNFYVIGAPKCGTTAYYSYLRTHPKVFLPQDKEPNFFLPEQCRNRVPAVRGLGEYLKLFDGASSNQLTGDTSVLYLYYFEAVRQILEVRPDAKLIVAVRNPVEMAYSWHSELYRTLVEDVADFEAAWRLQKVRRAGKGLPNSCCAPELLQYRKVCSLGSQLRRVYDVVPSNQRHVIVLDDFRRNPREEYLRLLQFLGLEDDGRTGFPVVHPNGVLRVRRAAAGILGLRRTLGDTYYPLRRLCHRFGLRPVLWLWNANLRRAPRPPLRPEFRMELEEAFRDEIGLLEELLRRSFTCWVRPRSTPEGSERMAEHAVPVRV